MSIQDLLMHKSLLEHFETAPEAHIDPSLKEKISGLKELDDGVEVTKGMMEVINEAVRYGLTSDLMVVTLDAVLHTLCNENGLDFDEENKSAQARIEAKENDDMM